MRHSQNYHHTYLEPVNNRLPQNSTQVTSLVCAFIVCKTLIFFPNRFVIVFLMKVLH